MHTVTAGSSPDGDNSPGVSDQRYRVLPESGTQ